MDRDALRRRTVLQAAEELVSARGFASVTMADIGAASNMSASALYLLFPSKADIVGALCVDRIAAAVAAADEALASSPDRDIAFRRMLLAHAQAAIDGVGILRIFGSDQQLLSRSANVQLADMDARYVERWLEYVGHRRPDLAPWQVHDLVTVARGALHSQVRRPPLLPRERAAELLASMAYAALLAPIEPGPSDDAAPHATQRSDRRGDIMSAMAVVAARDGFRNATMAEIGAAAGMSTGALYRFFDSKIAILAALSEEVTRQIYTSAEDAVAGAVDSRDRLARRQRAYSASALRNHESMAVIRRYAQVLPLETRRGLDRMERRFLHAWSDDIAAVRPELDPLDRYTRLFAALGVANSVLPIVEPRTFGSSLDLLTAAGLAVLLEGAP